MYQHPLYALLLSIIVLVIVVENCLQQAKLQKTRLSIAIFNVFIIGLMWLLSAIVESEIFLMIVNIFMIIEYVLFGVVLTVVSYAYLQKLKTYNNFIASFKNTTFNVYFLTDKKDRVKEISESLLRQFGLKREEIINKKFFDVVNKKVRFFKIDETDITPELLQQYYKDYAKKAVMNEEVKREIYFHNNNGQTTILNLIEKPIFFYGKYAGRMNVGQIKDDMTLMSVEKELVHKNNELEVMQHKFIASLELTEEGLLFQEIDQNYIWCNDILVQLLNMSNNTISIMDYHTNIHPDDIFHYKQTIDNLSQESPTYKIKYRYKVGYNFQYVSERGKKIFEKGSQSIVSYINKYESSYFAKTNYKELDDVKSNDELVTDLNILYNNNMNFDLIAIRTTNLPDINNVHSRQIGDMILAAYIKEVKNSFITASSDMYRISGTDFLFTITDPRKMNFFKQGLESGNGLNYALKLSKDNVVLEVNVGVAQSYNDGKNAQELIHNVKKALKTSINPRYENNYAFFKDGIND